MQHQQRQETENIASASQELREPQSSSRAPVMFHRESLFHAESPENSNIEETGFFSSLNRSFASFLARFSYRLSAHWLNLTQSSESCRTEVMSSVIERDEGPIEEIALEYNIPSTSLSQKYVDSDPVLALICLSRNDVADIDLRVKVVRNALAKDPERTLRYIQNADLSQISIDKVARVWMEFADREPFLALVNRDQFGVIDETVLSNTFTAAIDQDIKKVLDNLSLLPQPTSEQTERLATFSHEKQGDAGLERIRGKFNLSDAFLFPFAKKACETTPTLMISTICTKYLFNEQSKRQALVDILVRKKPDGVCKNLPPLVSYAGTVDLSEHATREMLYKSWSTVCSLRDKLLLPGEFSIKEMLYSRIERYADKMVELLPKMKLETEEWKDELALDLARYVPEHIPRICEHLHISDQQIRNQCFRIYCEAEPAKAVRWIESNNIQLDNRSQAALDNAFLRASPWKALKRLLKENEPDQKMLTKVAVYCAQNNATRMCKTVTSIPFKSPKSLGKVFLACAERNTWKTLDLADNFTGAADVLDVFHLAERKDPLRALRYKNHFPDIDELTIRNTLAYAVKKNANKTLTYLAKIDLPDHVETEYICMAVRKYPAGFKKVARELLVDKSPESRAQILAAATRGNIARCRKLIKENRKLQRMDISFDEHLVAAFALEQFTSAREGAPLAYKSMFDDATFVRNLVKTGIAIGRWDSALQAAKHLSHLETDNPETLDTSAGIQLLDNIAHELEEEMNLTQSATTNVTLLKKVRHAQCIPTNIIQRALDHFGEDDYEFLFAVMHQGGSTVAEATCQLLLSTYKMECDILSIDERIIQEGIRLGFRGLSPSLLKELRPIFKESVFEGMNTLKHYQELAGNILQGLPVPEALERSPLYPGLVLQAFTPIGMTESSVKRELQSVKDRSSHLSRFSYPKDGYGVRLADRGRVSVKPGERVTAEKLQEVSDFLSIDDTIAPLPAHLLLRRLLEGGFDQLNSKELWNTFYTLVDDPRIKEMSNKLKSFDCETASPKEQLEALSIMSEAISVVSYDAVLDIARSCPENTI